MSDRPAPMLVLAAACAAAPFLVLELVGEHHVMYGPWTHFCAVAIGASAATGAAFALTIAGVRRNDGRAVVVGSAFCVMAALLTLHGLTTPGLFIGMNGVVAFTGGATLPVGGAMLALTVLPVFRRPEVVKPVLVLLAAGIAGIALLGLAAILDPALVPPVPKTGSTVAWSTLLVGEVFFVVLAARALKTYLLTHRPTDLVVVVGLCWLASALVAALLLGFMQLGWWLGHGFEIAGILLVGVPVALDLRRSAPSRPLVGDLRGADLVAAEEAFLGSQVRALMLALAAKDQSTEEHTRRVALRAVQVGHELGLPSARLRQLAVGGLLHDIGKLSIPDELLRKPGPLTDEEFAVVQEHAERGRLLLRELGGFGENVLRLVHDHHERLDGSGYPRGLRGDEIDLDARILAVCDVYDALRSRRVYRDAWPHERAMSLLRGAESEAFDAGCVDALDRVLARERGETLRPAV